MLKREAISLIADIVAAVCHRRSSDLSSGFGCTNNSHSGKANEDVGAPCVLRGFVTAVENWPKTWRGSAYRNRSVGMDPLRRDGLRLNFKS